MRGWGANGFRAREPRLSLGRGLAEQALVTEQAGQAEQTEAAAGAEGQQLPAGDVGVGGVRVMGGGSYEVVPALSL